MSDKLYRMNFLGANWNLYTMIDVIIRYTPFVKNVQLKNLLIYQHTSKNKKFLNIEKQDFLGKDSQGFQCYEPYPKTSLQSNKRYNLQYV